MIEDPDDRLDQLAAGLGRTQARLDDVARARVGASIQAALGRPAPRRARRIGWLVAGVAAAALAVYLAPAPRPPVDLDAVRELRAEPAAPSARRAANASRRYEVAGATVTVYGPGAIARAGAQIVADASALTFDRPDGVMPVDLAIRGATIRVQHATFAVDTGSVLRVSVIRGELLLTCPTATVAQHVPAGGAATCDDLRLADRGAPASAPPATPASGLPDDPVGTPSATPAIAPSATPATAQAATPAIAQAATPATAQAATPATAQAATPAIRQPAITQPSDRTRPPLANPAMRPSGRAIAQAAEPPDDAPAPSSRPAIALRPPTPELPVGPVGASPPVAPVSEPASEAERRAARYATAERLIRTDPAAARAALTALIAEAPGAPEAAPALLDVARLAAAAGDPAAAHAALDRLAAHPRAAPLAMPAAYLRCAIERAPATLRACFTGFRAAFPDSPHDADVLARIVAAAVEAGDCLAARAPIAEYLQRYPTGPARGVVVTAAGRCPR